MDKKSLAILLVLGSSLTSSAYADNFVKKLMAKHHTTSHSVVKTHKTTKQGDQPYTDFTGTWVGNCGDGEDFTMNIENGYSYIVLSGEEFTIGQGLQGSYHANVEDISHDHTSFEWNADGTELIAKGVYVSKDNIDSSGIETVVDKISMTMKKGQINLDGKFVMLQDITVSDQPYTLHCVFNKSDSLKR